MRLPGRDDRGFVTVWTVAISASMFLIIGFTLDAGRIVRANSDAYGVAAAAARMAVNFVDKEHHVETGETILDETAGRNAAEDYIDDRGYEGHVDYGPGALEATVTVEGVVVPHMPGVPEQEITVHATAQFVQVAA